MLLASAEYDPNTASRRFKDTVAEAPDERRRWFDFERARIHERIRVWLVGEGFE